MCLCNPDITNKYTALEAGDPDDENPLIPDANITIDISLPAGWSLISLPVVPNNAALSDLFPTAAIVYGYKKGIGHIRIKMEEELEFGRGYWILLDQNQTYPINGQFEESYTHPVNDNGWEMIGGCSSAARASAENCNNSVIYGYAQGVWYKQVLESENLESGKG